MIIHTMSMWSTTMSRPGRMPKATKAACSTAIDELPGIPKARVGIRARPSLELVAASEAMTPSTAPVPDLSGCFDVLAAWA
jgi:hypothetical protein